jgi:uncharacterized protein
MEYKSVKGYTGWAQLGFLFAFLGLGFVLTGIIQLFFVSKMLPAGASILETDKVLKAIMLPENIGWARASQVVGTLMLLFIPAVLWSMVSNGKDFFWLGFNKYLNGYQVLIGFFIILAASVAAAPLADLSKSIIAHFPRLNITAKQMEDTYNEQVLALSNLKSVPEYLLALVIMAFFPAMFEEVFFRGAVQNLLVKWWKMPLLGIFVSAFVFSLIHMSIYLFISRLLLGFILGLMYHKTKNIWVNIIAHFLNNAIAVSQMFYMSKYEAVKDINKLDPHINPFLGLAAVAVLAGLFILLKKVSAENKMRVEAKENLLIAEQDPFNSFAKAENI